MTDAQIKIAYAWRKYSKKKKIRLELEAKRLAKKKAASKKGKKAKPAKSKKAKKAVKSDLAEVLTPVPDPTSE